MVRRFAVLGLLAVSVSICFAGEDPLAAEKYLTPPLEIMEAVLAPWAKNVSVTNISPDGARYVVLERDSLSPLVYMGKPYYNLGGLQVDYQANRSRRFTTRGNNGLRIVSFTDGKVVNVRPPAGTQISDPTWSPDGKQLACLVHAPDASRLYVIDVASGRSRAVTQKPLLLTLDEGIEWVDGGKKIVAVFVPNNRPKAPESPMVAVTPRVRLSDGKAAGLRTYAGLLDSPYDSDLLEYYGTGQLAVVDVAKGSIQPVGKPAMIDAVDSNPAGDYFRVTVMERPFSYLVTYSSFPEREFLWDAKGEQKAELTKRGLRLGRPDETPRPSDTEKRNLAWRPDGAGLSFIQVEPAPKRETPPAGGGSGEEDQDEQGRRGGGAAGAAGQANQPNRKDRVMLWKAPFGEKDVELVYENPTRIGSLRYSEDCKTLFITQTVGGNTQLNAVKLAEGNKVYKISESKPDDFYNDQGDLLSRTPRTGGGSVVRMSPDGKYIYLSGARYFKDPEKEAPRPFIDRVDIASGTRERVFDAKADVYETATLLDDNCDAMVVTRQSPTMVPNAFLVKRAGGEVALTDNKDYLPDITQAQRKTIVVTRPDGFKFQVKATLPRGAGMGVKPPALFWFYPSEFTDQAAYDRTKRTYNKNTFPGMSASNKAILLRAGYAVIEPDCPIIGPEGRMNDGYVPQLRNNLSATIDELDRLGWVDRQRLAIGGHSYGAFSTLNAMVHTPFFKAGIAGDGNYNRLLTPFGFQSEQRKLWEGREMYLSMSPMLYLEQLTGAVLLYHGIDDQNMGTDPLNSVKMFQALQALGKPAAMYMYPYEDHGQIGRETVLDQWARWVLWLDKYVKNPTKG
jgi:dipeptidyl aminopeptidase/acylaminoacyl peptidase